MQTVQELLNELNSLPYHAATRHLETSELYSEELSNLFMVWLPKTGERVTIAFPTPKLWHTEPYLGIRCLLHARDERGWDVIISEGAN